MPRCIVFIPDGNRRWAKRNMLSATALGHSKGRETAQRLIETSFSEAVKHVVFLAATDLNLLKRPQEEIAHLYRLLKSELRQRLRSGKKGTRLYVRGDWAKYGPDAELAELIRMAEDATARDALRSLTILFGHNGLDDVINASARTEREGESVNRESIRLLLPTGHIPQVDLVVRTGVKNNDHHLSGSLLPYHTLKAYFHFTETLWPDLTPEDLRVALAHFRTLPKREGA